MSDLLAYVSDSDKESFLLTDKRGRIVTANDAWEKMFGYSRKDIAGRTVDFLGGYMTNTEAYEEIIEGLKTQIKSVETTVFLHQADGTPFLTQVILVPNCSKFRGQPLGVDCLSQDFIGQLALEQEETVTKGTSGVSSRDFKTQNKVKLDWRITNKEVSYHLLRFGLICEPFLPYERHVTTAAVGNNTSSGIKTFRS
jgi:PAS domain S-box-containing protein